jgi:hypothetical protein
VDDNPPLSSAQGSDGNDQPQDLRDLRANALNPEELERQARETVARIKESLGGFGSRVRDAAKEAAKGATDRWKDASPSAPAASAVDALAEARARALARRWKSVDFLVDPDLPEGMRVLAVEESGLWRIEDRERAEARTLTEAVEPFRGGSPPAPQPVRSPWDYTLAPGDEIESGERRERLPDSGVIAACPACAGAMRVTCADCQGSGHTQCDVCYGRATLPCKRCRGRGYIAASASERLASAFLQGELERLSYDAAMRAADLSERLRREYGIPLPPSIHWAPGVTVASDAPVCPECDHGRVSCVCDHGRLVCETCVGQGTVECSVCAGSGKVVRYRDVVRRFETALHIETLPFTGATLLGGLSETAVRRAPGEVIWEGGVEDAQGSAPDEIPEEVWQAARVLIQRTPPSAAPQANGRHVISRRIRFSKVPVTHVEYAFAGEDYSFVAVGRVGEERFWADRFPHRWSRVQRFITALTRDQSREDPVDLTHTPTDITILEDYRARRRRAEAGANLTPAAEDGAEEPFRAADD